MAVKINDVKVKVNKPEVHFDISQFENKERELLRKKKTIIAVSTALTVGAVAVSNLIKLQKRIDEIKKR